MPFLFILYTQNRRGGNLPPLPKITNNITPLTKPDASFSPPAGHKAPRKIRRKRRQQ